MMASNALCHSSTKRKAKSLPSCDTNLESDTKRPRKLVNWAELDSNILRLIFNCLSSLDVYQAKAVCTHWCSVVKSLHKVPWLLLPPQEEHEEDKTSCFLLDFKGGVHVHNIKKNMPKEIGESCCIGSSHGYVIFFDAKSILFLLNPLTGARIDFPRIDTFLGILNITKNNDTGEYFVEHVSQENPYNLSLDFILTMTKQLRRDYFIHKAILSSDPCHSNNNYGVVLICGQNSKLAFCNLGHGDSSWTFLQGRHAPYHDIICHENQLCALGKYGSVEVWDLSGCSPTKIMNIEPPFPERSLIESQFLGRDLHIRRYYLVESAGKILLVERYIGEFVDGNGNLVSEEDLLPPLVFPYKTVLFHVHELQTEQEKWVHVESLNDHVLFVGGNHSASISTYDFLGCKGNLIYFTDDYWDRMNEDYLYGGHDMGVFDLKDGSIKPLHQFESMRLQPPPCWIHTS